MRSARLDQGPLALCTSVSTDWVRGSRTERGALHCACVGLLLYSVVGLSVWFCLSEKF